MQGNIFAPVSHSVHKGGGCIQACLAGGIPACLAGLQGVVSRPTAREEVEGSGWGVSPDPHPGGCVSQHALRQTPRTAIFADGTHPTGMHSCCY